jgi:hypothetical protein
MGLGAMQQRRDFREREQIELCQAVHKILPGDPPLPSITSFPFFLSPTHHSHVQQGRGRPQRPPAVFLIAGLNRGNRQ